MSSQKNLDDDWLLAFIQDTEEHHMVSAPSRLRSETLQKAEKQLHSQRIQLIIYSMRVSLAAAGAIFILFTMPFFLEQSWSKSTPPSMEKSAFGFPFSQGLIPFSDRENRQQQWTEFWNISESISDLSNELFGR